MLTKLWTCPICRSHHADAVTHCRRCGCELLRIVQLRLCAEQLNRAGEVKAAAAVARVAQSNVN